MKKMLLLLSHKLTLEQEIDAKTTLQVNEFLCLPLNLQNLWKNIPPRETSLFLFLEPIRQWLDQNIEKDDFVLIQGDFGATYLLVSYCFALGAIPIYATTERKAIQKLLPDKAIKLERIFKHQIFRKYEKTE